MDETSPRPRLAICLLTYARTLYALTTLRSALDNIVYSGKSLHVHIADDGSSQEHRDALTRLASEHCCVSAVSVSNSERGGYGRNVNLATQMLHHYADYVLMLEDDWELCRELDLNELIRDMEASKRINSIRLGYLSYTQSLIGQVYKPRHSAYLLLSSASSEPHVFAGHPRLEKVSYQRDIGPWPENLAPGDTEFAVAHRLAARQGVAWPMDLVRAHGDMFAHIGTERSY